MNQDEGLGNVDAIEKISLESGDEGLGDVRPEEAEDAPDDAGLGNVPPDEPLGLHSQDVGLGNVRGG